MKKIAVLIMITLITACSTLPGVGPSRSNIIGQSTQKGGSVPIIALTSSVAKAARQPSRYGFPDSFFQAGTSAYETIRPGDVLQITIWENTDNGLFATLGARVTPLSEMKVSASGMIFMPYVGQLKASGRTPEQLRAEIAAKLEPQTPNPQVEVRVIKPGAQGGVMVFTPGGGGLVPLNEGNLTLTQMLAGSGASGSSDPLSTRVTVSRGGQDGTILLQTLYDNAKYDIPMRNNDRIVLEADRRYFRMLGSGGAQALVPFARSEVSVLDAIAESGGLNAAAADPSGIFVFRKLSGNMAKRLLGAGYGQNAVNVVFTINLRDVNGVFLAQEFMIEDRDTIYITEAPFVSWTKVIGALTQTAGTVQDVQALGTTLGVN